MVRAVKYRSMKPGEEKEVCDLVSQLFHEYIAPGYPPEGVREFLDYANPEKMKNRLESGHFIIVAESIGEIIGVIEMREYDHIS